MSLRIVVLLFIFWTSLVHAYPKILDESALKDVSPYRPEFARDFNCSAGARMAPVNRCSIW